MKKVKKGKRKLRYDRIIIFLVLIFLLYFFITYLFDLKISNIYVLNNTLLSDQEIIEIAKISDYPSTLKNSSSRIKKRLKENYYINDVKVYKKGLTSVYIEIEESKPIFYYEYNNKTILSNGLRVDEKYNVPVVLNYITDNCYNKFIQKMANLDSNVLTRISEIKFSPNDVDDELFLLTMTDGNYVYINISTFDKLNKYISIKESLPDKIGILYLDYGNNFEILK